MLADIAWSALCDTVFWWRFLQKIPMEEPLVLIPESTVKERLKTYYFYFYRKRLETYRQRSKL